MCGHKKLNVDCADCRTSVKFWDSEQDYLLDKIRGVCDRLQKFSDTRLSARVSDTISNAADEIEAALNEIRRLEHDRPRNPELFQFHGSRTAGTTSN